MLYLPFQRKKNEVIRVVPVSAYEKAASFFVSKLLIHHFIIGEAVLILRVFSHNYHPSLPTESGNKVKGSV